MNVSDLQVLANGILGVIVVGLVIGGVIALIKGANISKLLGVLVGSFLLVGAAAVIVNWQTIGPSVTALLT